MFHPKRKKGKKKNSCYTPSLISKAEHPLLRPTRVLALGYPCTCLESAQAALLKANRKCKPPRNSKANECFHLVSEAKCVHLWNHSASDRTIPKQLNFGPHCCNPLRPRKLVAVGFPTVLILRPGGGRVAVDTSRGRDSVTPFFVFSTLSWTTYKLLFYCKKLVMIFTCLSNHPGTIQ